MPDLPPGQLLERFIQALNGNVFLREFSVSSGRLSVDAGEIEVADMMVLLRDLVLVYQLKERDPDADSSQHSLRKWFDKKVSGQAVGQIADSLRYLNKHSGRVVTNDRGHEVTLSAPETATLSSLVIYRAEASPSFRGAKGRSTSRAGFVHFIEASDYFRVCEILRTPVEVAEYLSFREGILRNVEQTEVSEKALMGQFLVDSPGAPEQRYEDAFDHLVDMGDDFDLSFMLQNLGSRVDYRSGDGGHTSHYAILQELALLPRSGLTALKERLQLCVATVRDGGFRGPTHFANPATDCGFLLVPWDAELGIPQENYLRTLAQLSKYSFGTRRQVGMLISDLPKGYYILWCFIDAPHVSDPALEAALDAKGCPLPSTTTEVVPRYHFDAQGLRRMLDS